MREEVPDDGRRLGLEGRVPATTAAPTIFADDYATILRQAARYYPLQNLVVAAMEAGADALKRDQALRDKVADLEVHTAELHDLLIHSLQFTIRDEYGNCQRCKQPAKLERHRYCWSCHRCQPEMANPEHTADCRLAHALAVQPPQHRQQLLGYQTSDGRLYQPEDITLVYTSDQGETQGGGP